MSWPWLHRSTKFLRTMLALRKNTERLRLEACNGEPTIESDPRDFIARKRALEVIDEIEGELVRRVSEGTPNKDAPKAKS